MIDKRERLNPLKLYSLKELEGVLGVTRRSLFNYIKDGKLKAFKVGGQWKVKEEDLKAFINGTDPE